MAEQRINADSLRAVIDDILTEYGEEATAALEEASKAAAEEVVKELRKGGDYNTNKTGKAFNRGWRSQEQSNRLKVSTVVFNGKYPNLAHLLEFGYVKRNGGRTQAFDFIAPVSDTVEQKFEAAFEKALNK